MTRWEGMVMTNEESLRKLEGDIAGDFELSMRERYEMRLAIEVAKALNRIGVEVANLHWALQGIEQNTRE